VNVVVAVAWAESVTVRVTVNGDPVVLVGVQPNDTAELLHPDGRPDHA